MLTQSFAPSALRTISWAGLVVGVLDGIAAFIAFFFFLGLNPFQVLQFIASSVVGPSTMTGGFPMVLIGLLLHFLVSFAVAGIYYWAYPHMDVLQRYPIVAGLLYGLGVWLVMNLLVLPASNAPKGPFIGGLVVVGILWHMLLVGLPTSLITAKNYANPAADL